MPGDDWETPPHIFQFLANHILLEPAQNIIWDPFYCTGRSSEYLQAAFPQKRIVHEDRDFFTWSPAEYDVIITNPPYSDCKKAMLELVRLDKPFAAFIRAEAIFTAYMQDLLRGGNISILVPSKRTHFLDPGTGNPVKGVRFHSLWVMYKIRQTEVETVISMHLE